jgi:hypothetical protein
MDSCLPLVDRTIKQGIEIMYFSRSLIQANRCKPMPGFLAASATRGKPLRKARPRARRTDSDQAG